MCKSLNRRAVNGKLCQQSLNKMQKCITVTGLRYTFFAYFYKNPVNDGTAYNDFHYWLFSNSI